MFGSGLNVLALLIHVTLDHGFRFVEVFEDIHVCQVGKHGQLVVVNCV